MLYLNPPYHIINGVSLFPDHEDKLQWYYLPVAPHLTQVIDTATGQPVPQISIIKFRGQAGNGGFLNFDVNIGIDDNALDDIRQELAHLENLTNEHIRLAPVPLIDGTVKLMLFDMQTGDPQPGAPSSGGTAAGGAGSTPPAGGLKFVQKISQAAHPALYGDNQAAFSVQLSQSGVTVLDQAIRGELSPIGIVYSLDFWGLRPAYSVRLNVDWDRVQKHLDEQFGIDSIFASTQIENAVDQLIDDRVIDLEVDTFVPEGEDETSVLGRRDQAVNEVRDMITTAFFEPSLNPVKEEEDGWDKVEHLAKTASALAATGGWGGIGSFTYKKIDYTRIDKKILNVNIRERTTVKRSIYPQGHLSGLFKVLREPGVDINRFILSVDLDDDWFQRRQVNVIPRADFDGDGLTSLNVTLEYNGQPKNVIFDLASPPQKLEWPSLILPAGMERKVSARYKVNFKSVDTSERPQTIESGEQVVEVDNLEVFPRELYSLVEIPIVALDNFWDHYAQVELQLRYSDPDHGINIEDNFMLDKDHHDTSWKMFLMDPQKKTFQYKITYHAIDNRDVELPLSETDDQAIYLRDPYPTSKRRTLEIVPVFNWAAVERAFVDVSYEDPVNQILVEQSYEFNKDNRATAQFSAELDDPNRRLVSYQVTVIYQDGRLTEIPRSYTLDRRIVVRDDMKGHRVITIRPDSVDFTQKNVQEMKVEAQFDDPFASLSFADNFTFQSPQEQAHFEYDYVDEARARFAYRITQRFTNGIVLTGDWETSDGQKEDLVVPVGIPEQ